jgi:ABC-2 type transport system ATP-binding protein
MQTTTKAALTLRGLHKVYSNGFVALHHIDLTIAAGEFFGLIGANGAGKSTLIGIVTGLVKKTSGSVILSGIDSDSDPYGAREHIGVVPQEFNFNIFEKPLHILIHHAGYFGIPRRIAIPRAQELLKQLNLSEYSLQEARRLSGGMKRRLMIARALMHHPRFLLLDEPTAGVDIETRHSTWEYLRQLNAQGVTILLTSHYLEEIEQLCQRAALIQKGQILTIDTVTNMVQSLAQQIYIVTLNHCQGLEQLQGYTFKRLDDTSLEVIINNGDALTPFILALDQLGITVIDLRPKRNRLEQLFLNAKNMDIHDS